MQLTWDRVLLWGFVLYGAWAFLSPSMTRGHGKTSWGDPAADLVKPNRKSGRRGVRAQNEENADVLASTNAV